MERPVIRRRLGNGESHSHPAAGGGGAPRDPLLYALSAALLGYVWRIQDLFPLLGKIRFVALVSAVAIVLYLLDADSRRALSRVDHPVTRYAIAILVLMVLSVPGSLYPGLSFGFIVQDHIKTLLLMVLLAAGIRTVKDAEFLVMVQMLGAGLYSLLILLRFDIGPQGRLGDLVYYDANDLGMVIICTLPLLVFHLRRTGGRHLRTLATVLLPITIMTIVKTGSRGAFLGLIAVVAFMVLRFRTFSSKARYGVAAAVLSLLLLAGNETYWELMRTLLNPQEDYNWAGQSEGGRIEVWKRGIGYMLQRPLTGVGAHAFPVAEGTISPLAGRQAYGVGLKWSVAHNSFIEIGAELGVLGLICFVLLLMAAFRTCARLGRGEADPGGAGAARAALGQAFCATLVGYLVSGFFLSQAYSAYLYATLGIIIGLAKLAPVALDGRGARGVAMPRSRRQRPRYGRASVEQPAAGRRC